MKKREPEKRGKKEGSTGRGNRITGQIILSLSFLARSRLAPPLPYPPGPFIQSAWRREKGKK
jgi:hypothetical protein